MRRAALVAGALAASFIGAPLLADDFVPRRFVPDAEARELQPAAPARSQPEASARAARADFEPTPNTSTLRWRVKPASSASNIAAAPSSNRVGFAERRDALRAHHNEALSDPFGDGKHAVRRAQFEVPAPEPEPEPMDLNQPERQPPFQPEEPETPPRRAPMRQPVPPAQEEPLPPPDEAQGTKRFDKYNDRNCDVDGKLCEDHRLRIKTDVLIDKDNLVDITPPLVLSNDTPEQRARADANFKRIPSREWRNRAGQVVADGKLMRVAYRHAYIADTISGEEVKIKLNNLGDDEHCFLAGWWNVPSECQLSDDVHPGRNFIPSTFTWTATAQCHKPLYFEDVQLERYGHTAGILQPAISGAHFFVNIAVLPYKMGINPPNECQYVLGYYRPGNCAPWMIPPVPLSVRGAAMQAGAVAGIWPLVP